MHSELHVNVVHHGVELLLLVSMLFLLAIPKSLIILKEFLCTSLMSRSPKFCITADEDPRIETFCNHLKLILRQKLANFHCILTMH